jgi:hypothetical protein
VKQCRPVRRETMDGEASRCEQLDQTKNTSPHPNRHGDARSHVETRTIMGAPWLSGPILDLHFRFVHAKDLTVARQP